MSKVNPKKKPKTQADVDRARGDGINDGVKISCAIILTVLSDKFDFADRIEDLWREINKLSEEVKERRVSVADLRHTLLKEYGIEV